MLPSRIINRTNEAYVSIESLISRDLLRTTPDATLSDVATTMISMASGSVLVFDAQELVGGDNPAGHRPGGLAGAEHRASPG
jgi:CBS domain-containing protein